MSTKKKLLEAAAGAAGGGVPYVDDVFSTFLYEGNSGTQTITNGIDLAGEGGLVWLKDRTNNQNHTLLDTVQAQVSGSQAYLHSNLTNAAAGASDIITSFNNNGFSLGGNSLGNFFGNDRVSWTFRKQPGFFDIVTYTGTGDTTGGSPTHRNIPHNLGVAPGMIITKRLDSAQNWYTWHRGVADDSAYFASSGFINLTSDFGGYQGFATNANQTSTHFAVRQNSDTADQTNRLGATYVAYLFAHDAQEFGENEDEAIIKCGSYTGNGSSTGPTINLGFEPQWLLIKKVTGSAEAWVMHDNMRGIATGNKDPQLQPDGSGAEFSGYTAIALTATGFNITHASTQYNENSQTYIYVAIRRPQKPASELTATDLLESTTYTGNGSSNRKIGSSITADMVLLSDRDATSTGWSAYAHYIYDRIRGDDESLATASTASKVTGWQNTYFNLDQNIGWKVGTSTDYHNKSGTDYVSNHFRRAPGFFDVVAYTGNQTARQIAHNLGVVPEMMWVKCRSQTRNWAVYHASQGNTKVANLNSTGAFSASTDSWNNTSPTSTHFTVGDGATTNFNPEPMIAYLFASVAGISKVGTYTGTGSSLNIDCGFTNGARFVLLKRTDTTGNWFFWDSARGIVSGNEPHLLLNGASAESSNDYIDPYSAGFNLTGSGSSINGAGGTFIFLAIA